jgi:aspartate aminotransferase-like enzyme
MIKKSYLLSPGPTPVPDAVRAAAAESIIHHRTPQFSRIYMDVVQGLQYVFGTRQDVFILTSSGSGAMESAVVNTLSPGDKVIVIDGGKWHFQLLKI